MPAGIYNVNGKVIEYETLEELFKQLTCEEIVDYVFTSVQAELAAVKRGYYSINAAILLLKEEKGAYGRARKL